MSFNPALLDNFNRGSETPLSGGGNWAVLTSGFFALKLVAGNVVMANDTIGTGSSYWTLNNFLDPEIGCTVNTLPTVDNKAIARLFGRLTGEGGAAASQIYYRLEIIWRSAAADEWTLTKNVSGVQTTLGTGAVPQNVAAGDKVGLGIVGNVLTAYIDTGSGWTQVLQRTDSAITATGKIGLGTSGTNNGTKLDDFRGSLAVTVLPQKSHPSRVVANPGAFTDESGGSVNIQNSINEASPPSDTTYIQSPIATSVPAIIRTWLEPENPPAAGSQILRTRYAKDASGVGTLNLKSRIYQGGGSGVGAGTLVAERTFTGVATGFVEDDYTLSGGEVALITDRGELYHELEVWLT